MTETINSNLESTGKGLVIARVFNAPRELVFKAYAEAERIAQWWGPKGFNIQVKKLEFQPGGIFHYSLKNSDGHEMLGKFVYQEIKSPEKIVFLSSFADQEGNTTRAPFSILFPLEVMNIVTLTEEDDNKTRLTLTGGPHNATAEEQKFFEDMHSSMQQGFKGTFEQLEEYLAKA